MLAEEHFDDMIGAQNDEMRPLSFQIKKLWHPQDKQVYIGLVNTVSCTHARCSYCGRQSVPTAVLASAGECRAAGTLYAAAVHTTSPDLSIGSIHALLIPS